MGSAEKRCEKRDNLKTLYVLVLLGALVGSSYKTAWARRSAKQKFEVGQQWTYRHEGPRPGSAEPNAIDGERILQVVSVVEEQAGTQWVIEERFTNSEDAIARFYVDEERLLTAIEMDNENVQVMRLRYDPPIPYQITDLDVGKDKTIETALQMGSSGFSLPSTIVTERLADETITTPAGKFIGCLHYKTTNKSTLDLKIAKIPVTEVRERWYHPKVNGLIKEIYKKSPVEFRSMSRPGYTATSVLTAFDTGQARTEIGAIGADQGRQDPNSPQSPASSGKTAYLILKLAVAILLVGILILVGWTRRKHTA